MKPGTYDLVRLRHGTSDRTFHDVVVESIHPFRHPDAKRDWLNLDEKDRIYTQEVRWQLTGFENKLEAINKGRTREVVELVTVGFDPENVIESK